MRDVDQFSAFIEKLAEALLKLDAISGSARFLRSLSEEERGEGSDRGHGDLRDQSDCHQETQGGLQLRDRL